VSNGKRKSCRKRGRKKCSILLRQKKIIRARKLNERNQKLLRIPTGKTNWCKKRNPRNHVWFQDPKGKEVGQKCNVSKTKSSSPYVRPNFVVHSSFRVILYGNILLFK
jgi:hypothetical protein